MIDHIGLKVKDFGKSKTFYQKALAPLGVRMIAEYESSAGFGTGEEASLWIGQASRSESQAHTPGVHVAIASPDKESVGAFHAAALKAGGKDNGAPGPRKDYGPKYYAAFVLDPDGNNIEAVFNK